MGGPGESEQPLLGIEFAEDEPEIAKVRDFFVTVAGGLEEVALREIKSRLKCVSKVRVERRQRLGRIHFRYDRSPSHLTSLECVEGVFADLLQFAGVTPGRPGLLRIAEAVSGVDLAPGVVLYNILNGIPEGSGVVVNCTVGRGHRFTSGELHQVIRLVLAETYGLEDDELQGPYSLHVRIEGKRGVIGFRLTERDPLDTARVPGDLTGATSRALVELIRPESGDVWVDIGCRSGNLGRAFSAKCAGVVVLETRLDWVIAGEGVEAIAVADGISSPLRDASVNGVIVNARRRSELRFDETLQAECLRLLGAERYGQVVLLCERDREMEAEMDEKRIPFKCVLRHPVHLGGDPVSLYHLRVTG